MGYYYTTRWAEKAPAIEGADGRVLMPSGVPAHVQERRHIRPRAEQPSLLRDSSGFDLPHTGPRVLLDPQLYLAGISADTCVDACTNLVGYPWFARVAPPAYDSTTLTESEYTEELSRNVRDLWRGLPAGDQAIADAARAAVEFQVDVGCSDIILPSPLTVNLGDTYATELIGLIAG